MCPYHSEVTDISLAAGEAGRLQRYGSARLERQALPGREYKGDRCKFKPEMTTQSYWDERAEKLEQKSPGARRARRAAAQLEQPVNELPEVETPTEETR
jgi:hypothetical protein